MFFGDDTLGLLGREATLRKLALRVFVGCGLSVTFCIFFCGLWSVGARFGGFHAEGSTEFRRGAWYVSTADRQTDRQKHLFLYIMRPACVRPCVRATRGSARVPRSAVARDGYRGPTREGKKENRGRRIDARGQKGGKKIFRRERWRGREEKKIFFGRERKKILASTRTQPTKRLT